jgi:HNH endonuclease
MEGKMAKTLEERFWNKVDKNGNGCWLWLGTKPHSDKPRSLPYGMLGIQFPDGRWKMRGAHRISYELNVGPIPKGMTLDHQCNNPSCVNPSHLVPATMKNNLLRGNGIAARCARKTHCKRGHPLSGDNLHIRPNGARICRACDRLRYHEGR